MYRLLFLFYIESRPDLGYSPMGSEIYRLGYSLESLRDMEYSALVTEEDKESFYISDSLNRLFQMIWDGFPKRDDQPNRSRLIMPKKLSITVSGLHLYVRIFLIQKDYLHLPPSVCVTLYCVR